MGRISVLVIAGALAMSATAYAGDFYSCSMGYQQTVKSNITKKPVQAATSVTKPKEEKVTASAQTEKTSPEG